MPGDPFRSRRALRLTTLVGLLLAVFTLGPRQALAQTPSPLQEWQYPGGISLYALYEPDMPTWRVVLGIADVAQPRYDGADPYHIQTGPVIDIRYKDVAFLSVGEGIGVNLFHGTHHRIGVALDYDLGRKASDYPSHLQGLGDISAAPVVKLFGSYTISRSFPLVIRMDVREIIGGAHGTLGDIDAFLPLPGSSEKLIMLAGPSLTFADRRNLQSTFGVSVAQARDSQFPVFNTHGGATEFGFGFSATRFFTKHWMISSQLAINRLVGSASDSPITQSPVQGVIALSVGYRW